MSEIKIRRRSRDIPITLHSTTTLSTTIRMEDFAGGIVEFGTMAAVIPDLLSSGVVEEIDEGTYRASLAQSPY